MEPVVREDGVSTELCTCFPCESPQYGVPGRDHCAACCYGTLIEEYDEHCPVDEHRVMACRQFGLVAEGRR